jgi:tripartite-type tricarboxylate transporter receptor subunit TctC
MEKTMGTYYTPHRSMACGMQRPLRRTWRLFAWSRAAGLALACLGAGAVHAQGSGAAQATDWPSKPIRLVVGYPPGGANDQMARLFAQRLGKTLGVSVVVENRAGADGVLGTQYVAQSPPDGYTLASAGLSPLVLSSFTFPNIPYDSLKDFAGASTTASMPLMFVVRNSLPVHNMQELVDYAKANPGKLNFATAGTGGSTRVILELLKQIAHVDIHYISYKGGAPALTDLLADRLDGFAIDFPLLYPLVKQGRLRALAMTGEHRSPLLPDVPTVKEAGFPGLTAGNWYAVLAPKGTPKAIVDKLNATIVQIDNTDDMKQAFQAAGAEAMSQPSPAAFDTFLKAEYERWGKVIKAAGIKAE